MLVFIVGVVLISDGVFDASASEPWLRIFQMILWDLADADTTLAKGPAEWCQSEVVNVDVSVVGMIDRVLTMES